MDILKKLSEENKNGVLEFLAKEIEERQLKWCCDTEQFIQGLLLGLEAGMIQLNKYSNDESIPEDKPDD